MSKQRWKDTLPDIGAHPRLDVAASFLSYAMRSPAVRELNAAQAAAHIRAYRKSLGVKSERDVVAWPEQDSDEQVLWRALTAVTWAARYESVSDAAMCCRMAEADLRELWKRGRP